MKRYKIVELLGDTGRELLGQEITVKGWVRAFRSNRFIQLNDGSCMSTIQAVVDFEQFEEAVLKRITTASALSLTGQLVESIGSGQALELQVSAVEILGDANPDEVQKPVTKQLKYKNQEGVVEVVMKVDEKGNWKVVNMAATNEELAKYVLTKLKDYNQTSHKAVGQVVKYRFVFKKQV